MGVNEQLAEELHNFTYVIKNHFVSSSFKIKKFKIRKVLARFKYNIWAGG